MHAPIVRTDKSAIERVRDAILNRGNPTDDDDESSRGPGVPLPG
ncbi:hypothetical protein [Halomarina ordinaria]|nr:hypothetical protein [Halomarina sp. PSRA2]